LSQFSVEEQYFRCRSNLESTGIIKQLPLSKSRGVIGIDSKEYPIPTADQVSKVFELNYRLVKLKTRQGFDRLELVPFAMPIRAMAEILAKEIICRGETGQIYKTSQTPNDLQTKTRVNKEKHVWFWQTLLDGIDNDALVYFPSSYTVNNIGKSKLEIISDPHVCAFLGWSIGLTESYTFLPKQGDGKTIADRKQLEYGFSPNEYREILKNTQYFGETGRTIEDFIIAFLSRLNEKNEISNDINDCNATWLLGQYLKVPYADLVAVGRWIGNLGRVRIDLHRSNNKRCTWNVGATTTVRLEVKVSF
jgi:hypothetical protein